MSLLNRPFRVSAALTIMVTGTLWSSVIAKAQLPQPLVSEETLTRVSDHVYAVVGFPNVGIVVGDRGTLIIDTGLGERNGATVVRLAQKLAKGPNLYLTNTHYHSEHTAGEQAFPANTVIIRPTVQQEEMNKRVAAHLEVFRKMSAQNQELLQNVKFRTPDILFDREMKLNLGGVTTRLFCLGAAHTVGDELVFVEEDSVLLPGDIVQKNIFPILPNEDASLKGWLAILDNIEALHPRWIVPDHGAAVVDASQIGREREYFLALQTRALELKRQGVSADNAGKQMTTELHAKYPDWPNPNNIAGEVQRVYEQAQ